MLDPKDFRNLKIDDDLFNLIEDGIKEQDSGDLDIIGFIKNVLNNFDKDLFVSQRVILKALYCLPFDEEEQKLMDRWVREKKCNWEHPDILLKRANDKIDEFNKTQPPEDQIPHKTIFEFQELIIEAGMRSSKTTMAALVACYEYYRLSRMKNPQDYFGLPSSSFIFMTVMATTAGQGENTVYGAVKNLMMGCNYFQGLEKDNRLSIGQDNIKFPEKNMVVALGHSKATAIVGRSAPVVIFDEIAMFSTDDGHTSNAEEVYARVGRAAATFGSKAKRIAISSVKQQGDFMEKLVADNFSKADRGTLVFSLTTFDVNPIMTMHNPIILADYERDIEQAQRDYENLRPGSMTAFINPIVIDNCTTHDATKYATWDLEYQTDTLDGERSRTYINLELNNITRPKCGHVIYAHADPGVRKDSFGFVVGHPEYTERGVVTVIDLVLEWIPQKAANKIIYEVNIDNVEENIIRLNKLFKFTHVTFDQWESHGAIQRLFRAGIPTFKQQFAKNNQLQMYKALRQRMKDNLVQIPDHPTLIEELKNLELNYTPSGGRVQHPKNKDSAVPGRGKISKDLADGVAMVNWLISSRETQFDRDSGFVANPDTTGNFIKRIGRTRSSDLFKGWQ